MVVTQSSVVPSLKAMDCINIQILEKELESVPVVVVEDQGIEVQHCKHLSGQARHQQLPQKWFSEALMFFWSSLLCSTHLHHALNWWWQGGRDVICLLNLTVVLLCQSCTRSH